jgi:putative restriction endonuclease
MKRNNWSEEELVQVLFLYCRTPLGRMNSRNPEVISLSQRINRTPGSISLKLGNFISLYPKHKAKGIVGSVNSSKLDRIIWEKYSEDLDSLTDAYIKVSSSIEGVSGDGNIESEHKTTGIDTVKISQIKQRLRQQFFRETVLSSYNNSCCITGISNSKLLNASHIVPWSVDEENRLNPRNGLCLNALHDKAFDSGLLTIDNDFKVVISSALQKDDPQNIWFKPFHGKHIRLPLKFLPNAEFIKMYS